MNSYALNGDVSRSFLYFTTQYRNLIHIWAKVSTNCSMTIDFYQVINFYQVMVVCELYGMISHCQMDVLKLILHMNTKRRWTITDKASPGMYRVSQKNCTTTHSFITLAHVARLFKIPSLLKFVKVDQPAFQVNRNLQQIHAIMTTTP